MSRRYEIPAFPSTLADLLAMREWKGSTVTREGLTLVIRHPNGQARMDLHWDAFERIANAEAVKRMHREAYEARLVECVCGRYAIPKVKGRTWHNDPHGKWHRFNPKVEAIAG